MMNNYLNILEDSLVKKISILKKVQELSDKQAQILNTEPLSMEAFDQTVEEKDVLIQELSGLDEGFDTLYGNIKEGLLQNKEQYADRIKKLQQLIQEVMDKSVAIQAQEERNRDKVTAYFRNEKKNLAAGRRSSKAAYDYYKNMSKANVVQPQFMDKKK